MAAGVVPQSSCSLRPSAPASTCSRSGSGSEALPLPMKPRFIGKASAASSIRAMFHAPGVQVVALVPVAGPVPPPSMVVMPLDSASSICCGAMKWMCESMPPAVRIMPSPAMTSVAAPTIRLGVTPSIVPGLPALPMPTILPSRMPTSALTMPQWSRISALVMTRSSAPSARVRLVLPHAVAQGLAAAELGFVAVSGVIALDFDNQLGIGEAHAVADGGSVQISVNVTGDAEGHG